MCLQHLPFYLACMCNELNSAFISIFLTNACIAQNNITFFYKNVIKMDFANETMVA